MQRFFIVLLVIFLTPACSHSAEKIKLTEKQLLLQSAFFQKAMVNTPYSALIKVTSVEIVELPDSDKSDDYAEQQLIFHADVLESYRGKKDKKITYIMFVEKGETVDPQKEPFIITLCQSKDGLFWPGVGAIFSSDNRLRTFAKKYSKQVNNEQLFFSDCE